MKKSSDVLKTMLGVTSGVFMAWAGQAATTVTFPGSGGDLSSEDAWNGQMPEMTTETIVKVLPSTTAYTISTNMTLAPLEVSGGSNGGKATFDLSVAEGEDPITVKMAGDVKFAENESGCIRIISKRNAEFIGGIWDFGGKKALTSGSQTYTEREICLSGGCVWTNLVQGNFVYNYSGMDNNRLLVTDDSQLHVTGGMYLNEYGACNTATMGAQSGGLVKIGGELTVGRGTTASVRQRVFSSGDGSRLIASGKLVVGASGDKDNVVEALDGGYLSFGGTPYFTYSDYNDGIAATGNVLRAVGPGSRIDMIAVYFGKNANACELVTGEDGKKRAVVTEWKGSHDNIIAALDGGIISNQLYYLRGTGNGFVVSNGVLATTGNGICCQSLPNPGGDDTKMLDAAKVACTNAFLRLQGDHPLLTMDNIGSGNFDFSNGFRFIYDLPVDGYAEGYSPIYSLRWGVMDETTKLELNGIEDMQKDMLAKRIRKRTMTLWTFRQGMNSNDTIVKGLVQKWNSEMPKGVTLSGTSILTLTVKVDLGLSVIVR